MRNAMWVGGGITGMGEIPMLGTTVKGLTALIKKIFYSGAQGFAYDPNDLTEEKIKWRRNLFNETEFRNGITDASIKSGSLSPVAFAGLTVGTGIQVDPSTSVTYLYKSVMYKADTPYTFSCYVRMLDGSSPRVGESSVGSEADMHLVVKGAAVKAEVQNLGDGLYRIFATVAGAITGNYFGVVKYPTNSSKPVIVSGYQLEEASQPTEYQAFTDFNSEFIKRFPLHTLYQDATGTVPVTAAGQPVGLILDKSKGLMFGSSLIPNGSFSSDTSWSKGAGWTIADGVARFDGSASFSNLGGVASPSINGKWLRVELDLSNVGALVTQVRILASGALAATIPVSGAGKYSAMILGGSVPSIGIQTQNATGANYAFTLDNVSVKEAFGNHAYQTVSASRPILRQTPILGSELVTDNTLIASPAQSTIRYFNFSSKMPNLQAGKTYKIEYTLRNYAGGGVVGLSGNNPAGFSSFNQTANGTYSTVRYITANGSLLFVVAANTGVDVVDISVKEVTGYRTDQNYLEFDGSDDFLQTSNIDFTGTDKVSLFAGVNSLSNNPGVIAELGSSISNAGSFTLINSGGGLGDYAAGSNLGSYRTAGGGILFQKPDKAVFTVTNYLLDTQTLIFRRNGVLLASSSASQGTGNYGNYPLYISRRGGTLVPFNGRIYGLIGIGKLTTDTETAAIEKELAKRVGVTLNV